jgi:hypothetical protein
MVPIVSKDVETAPGKRIHFPLGLSIEGKAKDAVNLPAHRYHNALYSSSYGKRGTDPGSE